MVIVDTTVWIDYLRGAENAETLWLDREMQSRRLGLTDLILCEVLHGVHERKGFLRVQAQLMRFQIFETGGGELAVAAALNYRELRYRGYAVRRTIDCLIATFCLATGNQLLHRDRDFDPFETVLGLKVLHP
jgi:predicted nucleic acid-binding protein